MPIRQKLNERIKLISQEEDHLLFQIDGTKEMRFFTGNQKFREKLLNFVNNGTLSGIIEQTELDDLNKIRAFQFFENLKENNFIDYHIELKNELAIINPKSREFRKKIEDIDPSEIDEGPYVLSRFAYLCKETDRFRLDSPNAHFCVLFTYNLLLQLFSLFNGKITLSDLKQTFKSSEQEVTFLLILLIQGGYIHTLHYKEPEHLSTWEFHDLLFHSTSRLGQSIENAHFGATYRFRDTMVPPPPEFKEVVDEHSIILQKPNMEELQTKDHSFSRVLENRRSLRNYDKTNIITMEQLAYFLYRSVSVRQVISAPMQDAVLRPYPSAGAIHEIEFYIVVASCSGLSSDIYYYHSLKHILEKLNVQDMYLQKIIKNACTMLGSDEKPQILIILTSRFQKIAWKYEKIAYRSTLLSVGAALQTMSLVATAMNLGSCILGTGDSNLFAEAINLDPFKEGAVGEFILGTI